jgi:peptidylprolyl isomerase
MKQSYKVLTLLFFPLICFAEAKPNIITNDKKQSDIAKLSEAFGHMIGKNIDSLGVKFDIDQVAKGIKDSSQGKQSPMSEEECVQALTAVQEAIFKKQAEDNLARAEAFLSDNAKSKGVVSLHQGKLQYKIEKTGKGSEVQPHFTPLVRYQGKYLDGTVFGSSKQNEPLSLDETITGIQEGLVGMKEGEKRTLYIHPSLAYGTTGFLPPNSLLTFEVELIQANSEVPEASSVTLPEGKDSPLEVVGSDAKRKAVR